MSLSDELNKKQALKFQLNGLNIEFIKNTLLDNVEGIFNLSSKINGREHGEIMGYLLEEHRDYIFEYRDELINPKIYFKNENLSGLIS